MGYNNSQQEETSLRGKKKPNLDKGAKCNRRNNVAKFLCHYFKDKGDRLSSKRLRYSEVVIEALRELK